MNIDKNKLSPGLANFEVVNNPPSLKFRKAPWGDIDFTKISEAKANLLVSKGFPYLHKKGEVSPKIVSNTPQTSKTK